MEWLSLKECVDQGYVGMYWAMYVMWDTRS
jgi:hypothetical protein